MMLGDNAIELGRETGRLMEPSGHHAAESPQTSIEMGLRQHPGTA
jgi:hypothetical protein